MTCPTSILYSLFMNTKGDTHTATIYEIRLQGHLSPRWTEWFTGFRIELQETGDTLLTGPVADQAALYGVLKKVRDLGLPLLAVNRIPGCQNKEMAQ